MGRLDGSGTGSPVIGTPRFADLSFLPIVPSSSTSWTLTCVSGGSVLAAKSIFRTNPVATASGSDEPNGQFGVAARVNGQSEMQIPNLVGFQIPLGLAIGASRRQRAALWQTTYG